MPALRPWPARWPVGKRPDVNRYELKTGESFVKGDLVTKDGSDIVSEVTGSDPTDLLGFAAEDAASVLETGYVLVYTADTDVVWFAMQGTSAPVAGDVGQDYGIVRDSDDVWTVDKTDAVNTRVTVNDVDTVRNLFLVSIMSAHRQSA